MNPDEMMAAQQAAPMPMEQNYDGMNDQDFEKMVFQMGMGENGLDLNGQSDAFKKRFTSYLMATKPAPAARTNEAIGLSQGQGKDMSQGTSLAGLMGMATRGQGQRQRRPRRGLMG